MLLIRIAFTVICGCWVIMLRSWLREAVERRGWQGHDVLLLLSIVGAVLFAGYVWVVL